MVYVFFSCQKFAKCYRQYQIRLLLYWSSVCVCNLPDCLINFSFNSRIRIEHIQYMFLIKPFPFIIIYSALAIYPTVGVHDTLVCIYQNNDDNNWVLSGTLKDVTRIKHVAVYAGVYLRLYKVDPIQGYLNVYMYCTEIRLNLFIEFPSKRRVYLFTA